MCPLNYWDMGYSIVILSIFRDVFSFWPVSQFLFCFRFVLFFICKYVKGKTCSCLMLSFCDFGYVWALLGGYLYPVSLRQNGQISHIPKIHFRSKASFTFNIFTDEKQNKTKTEQKLWHVFGVVWSCFVYNKTTYIYMQNLLSGVSANRQISHIPKIHFRSKAKNIPKNTQNDNGISHVPVIQRRLIHIQNHRKIT
jgi:hypothetical protein